MKNRFNSTLKGKVLLWSLAGFVTLLVINFAVRYSFEKMNDNIEYLATPNQKLVLVNRLFREVSQLNHLQYEKAISGSSDASGNPVPKSESAFLILDSLSLLLSGDSLQNRRVGEIMHLLAQREELLYEFLNLKYQQNTDPDINHVLEVIKQRITSKEFAQRIVKYETTTVTKTVSTDTLKQERSGFFNRLFGKNSQVKVNGVIQKEEIDRSLNIVVDTIKPEKSDTLLAVFGQSLDSIQKSRIIHGEKILQKELMLVKANSNLIQQIVEIINSLEKEELYRVNQTSHLAYTTARKSIGILNVVIILFVVVSVVFLLLIITDITRSKTYRQKLEEARDKAYNEAIAKQRFLSNMSHEIRTPLQSIYGYAEQARLNPREPVNIDAIYFSAEHLLNLVNEVLDYSKFSLGKLVLESALFNPFQAISNVVAVLQSLTGKKGLLLDFKYEAPKELMLEGDAFRLKQIAYNLIGNAIKFTEQGAVTVKVVVQEQGGLTQLTLEVKDTGIGISSDKLSVIFDEFGQSDASVACKYGGSGLGLAIVKKLVEIHQGRINVESEPGVGSVFLVTLPYKKVQSQTSSQHEGSNVQDFKPNLVWFADDDALILQLGLSIMKKQGVSCETFSNGQELLVALEEREPDVIFLDMRMPGLSGKEVLQEIRKRKGFRIRVIALTAHALLPEQQEIRCCGFNGLIIKPFKESGLLRAMGQMDTEKGDTLRLNISTLERMAADSNEVNAILQCVLDESRNDLNQIGKDLWLNNIGSISLLIHRMAGRSGQVGATEYASRLRSVEQALNQGLKGERMRSLVKEAMAEGDTFLTDLEQVLRERKQ